MQPNEIDTSIGEVTEHLLLWRKETRAQLAALLGLSLKTVNRRIAGERRWEAWEIEAMARHFGRPVEVFYAGPDALIAGPDRGDPKQIAVLSTSAETDITPRSSASNAPLPHSTAA